MTSPLTRTALRLDEAAAQLGGVAGADPGPTAFGADLPGRLGTLGVRLHEGWRGELAEHDRATATLATRLTGAAAALRTAGGGYVCAEDASTRLSTRAGES